MLAALLFLSSFIHGIDAVPQLRILPLGDVRCFSISLPHD